MPLAPGTRLGPYEVAEQIGAGGMGEVYRATDTNLGRHVAIKVLPDEVAQDAERLARFEREARTLASLNHPAIAIVHGLEKTGPVRALVMELVEGPTLAERIGHGAIPLDEALPIAKQMAEALEAAHEHGVIHRDLKPANIKVRPDGAVKVLDFGLAKAMDPPGVMSASGSMPPTITTPAMTQLGVILGTAAYMSPEQARGRAADRRSDIWAFGCVVYEMLTGRRAFEGDDITDTLAVILRGEPAWEALPSNTPRHIERLLRRCLEKDPRQRLQAIGDARLEIDDVSAIAAGHSTVDRSAGQPSRTRPSVPLVAAVIATAVVVGAGTWILKPSPAAPAAAVTRSLIAADPFDQRGQAGPDEKRVALLRPVGTSIALSPDGRTLVVRAVGSRGAQLFLRPLDRLELAPMAGTEGAEWPMFSPDGAWIAFWVNRELRKVPVAGGPVTTVVRAPDDGPFSINGTSWGDGEVIVFGTTRRLWRVSASGGAPQPLTTVSSSDAAHRLPHVLPGGKAILFTITKEQYRWDNAEVVVRSLVSGEQRVLLTDAADARYVPTGHILFARRGSLVAAPFDLDRLEVTGGGVTVVESVMQAINQGSPVSDSGATQFAVSTRGTLAYVGGGASPDEERVLVWVNRDGRVEPMSVPPARYLAPRLSPDGSRIAVHTASGATSPSRIWTYDVARRTLTPLTMPEERGAFPVWTPDGSRIAFLSDLGAEADLYWKPSSGGSSERLTTRVGRSFPASWTTDGKQLVVVGRNMDIAVLDLSGPNRALRAILETGATESQATLSQDGRWMAFTSADSGRNEVYMQPFPGPGSRLQVSTEGGHSPAWRGDGREVFYLTGGGTVPTVVYAVSITHGPKGPSIGTPVKLFEGRYRLVIPVTGYDVTPDGKRFVMTLPVDRRQQPATELVLVEHWFDELRARVK